MFLLHLQYLVTLKHSIEQEIVIVKWNKEHLGEWKC